MKKRSELRDIIVKILYQMYILDITKDSYDIDRIIRSQIEDKEPFVDMVVKQVKDNQETVTSLANKYLTEWKIDRLSKVDKAILSLGIFELVYTDTPPSVVINEAVELAKKYSDDRVVKMINACLDKVYHKEVKRDG